MLLALSLLEVFFLPALLVCNCHKIGWPDKQVIV